MVNDYTFDRRTDLRPILRADDLAIRCIRSRIHDNGNLRKIGNLNEHPKRIRLLYDAPHSRPDWKETLRCVPDLISIHFPYRSLGY